MAVRNSEFLYSTAPSMYDSFLNPTSHATLTAGAKTLVGAFPTYDFIFMFLAKYIDNKNYKLNSTIFPEYF